MISQEAIRVALDALRANKFRSALTMLGVVIGVASIILLVSIGEGAKSYITKQFMDLGTNILVVLPGKQKASGGPMTGLSTTYPLTYDDMVAAKRRNVAVKETAPLIIGTGPVKFRNRKRSTTVIGTTYDMQDVRNLHVEVGSFIPRRAGDAKPRERVAVLGRTVKQELFGDKNPLGSYIRIDEARFRVIGIMERKGRSLGFDIDDLVFIPIGAAEKLFNTESLFEMLVTVRTASLIPQATRELERELKHRHHETADFTVIDQAEMVETFGTVLSTLTYVLAGIAAISLVVGGIGIMNIMLISVSERTREIGIRKAIGAKRRDILAQFLTESATISLAGGLVGLAIGWGGGALIHWVVPSLPVQVSLWSVGMAVGFSLGVGVFFGVYPAKRAAALDPIEALRYE
ncbi:MAG TPA: ABC transporter permease [Planctomycetota bacterium]|nr:ABC transporter permease [Planctomycetota bacterium]